MEGAGAHLRKSEGNLAPSSASRVTAIPGSSSPCNPSFSMPAQRATPNQPPASNAILPSPALARVDTALVIPRPRPPQSTDSSTRDSMTSASIYYSATSSPTEVPIQSVELPLIHGPPHHGSSRNSAHTSKSSFLHSLEPTPPYPQTNIMESASYSTSTTYLSFPKVPSNDPTATSKTPYPYTALPLGPSKERNAYNLKSYPYPSGIKRPPTTTKAMPAACH